eukprot:g19811.t1
MKIIFWKIVTVKFLVFVPILGGVPRIAVMYACVWLLLALNILRAVTQELMFHDRKYLGRMCELYADDEELIMSAEDVRSLNAIVDRYQSRCTCLER